MIFLLFILDFDFSSRSESAPEIKKTEEVRAVRAVEALADIGPPEAQRLLEALAKAR